MSREGKTSIGLIVAAVAVSVAISYRMWLPSDPTLGQTVFYLGFNTVIFLAMAFLWGAANAGIAALWASLRKRQPSTLGAFNFGIAVFLVVQVLAQLAYEDYKSAQLATNVGAAPSASTPMKETN